MKAGDLVLYRIRSADKRSTGEGMRVLCEVKEVREVFGRQDLLIAPVSGDGELRVSSGSVELSTSLLKSNAVAMQRMLETTAEAIASKPD